MHPKKSVGDLFFLLIGCWTAYVFSGREWLLWLIIGIASVSLTPLARIITDLLDMLLHQLALGLLKIALALVFFLILVPTSFIRRISGANRKFFGPVSDNSNWQIREHTFGGEDLQHPW